MFRSDHHSPHGSTGPINTAQVIATVPWDLLFDVRGSTAGKLPKLTRAFRAFRLLRLLKLGKLLRQAKKTMPFFDDFMILGTAIQYMIILMLFSHYLACGFRFVSDQGCLLDSGVGCRGSVRGLPKL